MDTSMEVTTRIPPTTASLYPVRPDAESAMLVAEVLTPQRNGMIAVLRRALTVDERSKLRIRLAVISAAMVAAAKKEIAKAVAEMLTGFGSSAGADEARATTAQYVSALLGLPLWAIQRSCGRWARGEVHPGEVGAKLINRAFAPTTAQLRITADKIVQPFLEEMTQLGLTLRGEPDLPEMTAEQRERMGHKLNGLAESLRSTSKAVRDKDIAEAEKAGRALAQTLLAASDRLRRPNAAAPSEQA